ncbi:hypothetical protein [Vibrio parahaemolyticus]|uniref:Uncharacterized protein n=1 Tax=Vibrio parahaemolyticus TaxID=670 RepID=A0AAW8QA04_VIBPH|nr:hypothetical protein [Vibrio parahaemolyticus]MBE3701174.1 hypothetical protein [Vibrio parahaemolyticus]MBE3780404.1 hypothetical protein [Vibrio parahaemolyticus]MCZ5870616.1 hypothetical protein [Vibrio parahaemolyticus]MCZ5901090.1 hypothetical protein [Vibrio parahaemolyticus]MCZ6023657.1 hypothetical protein [Vibrio parahaemolyticus]
MGRNKKKRTKKYTPRKSSVTGQDSRIHLKNWYLARRVISILGVSLVIFNMLLAIALESNITARANELISSSGVIFYLTMIVALGVLRTFLALWMNKNSSLIEQNVPLAKKLVATFIFGTILAAALFVTPVIYLSGVGEFLFNLLHPHFPKITNWIVDVGVWFVQAIVAGVVGGYSYDRIKRSRK